MILLLAHHEVAPGMIACLITVAGPALFFFRCWLHERRRRHDQDHQH